MKTPNPRNRNSISVINSKFLIRLFDEHFARHFESPQLHPNLQDRVANSGANAVFTNFAPNFLLGCTVFFSIMFAPEEVWCKSYFMRSDEIFRNLTGF